MDRVANVTLGADLPNGEQVPSNLLLIVPLADGGGVHADSDIILMIKGDFEIK